MSPDYGDTDADIDPGPAIPQEDQSVAEMTAAEALSEAKSAFLKGDYRKALRMAGHAELESPQNAQVHESASLALFALGDYWAPLAEPMPPWSSLHQAIGQPYTITTTWKNTPLICASLKRR